MLALAPQFAVQVGALVITGSKPSVILCLFAYEFPVWMLILPSVFRPVISLVIAPRVYYLFHILSAISII